MQQQRPHATPQHKTPQFTVAFCILMRVAGSETLLSLGSDHQASRLTQPHTGSATGPAVGANRSQESSAESPAISSQGVSPERQALSVSRQPTFHRRQESSAGTSPSSTNPLGPGGTFSSNGDAHLSTVMNRQPMSAGLNSSGTTISAAKPVGNADTGRVLFTSREMLLLSAAAAEGSADSTQASSPTAATWQSSALIPGRGQKAVSPVRDQGLLPSQPISSAGAIRQMPSPSRHTGISPTKHTDLQKQNEALRFKLQVLFRVCTVRAGALCLRCVIICVTMHVL